MIQSDQRLCERLRLAKASPREYYMYYKHTCVVQFSKHSELHERPNVRGNMIRFSEAEEILVGTTECRPAL
jgi:hypothetical protein